MKDITTELTVPPYLFDWLVNKYGNPLRFPARSPHNDLLHALVAVARPKQGGEEVEQKRGMTLKVVLLIGVDTSPSTTIICRKQPRSYLQEISSAFLD